MLRWPQAAHRLDAETGGLLICAKTTVALQKLSSAFAARSMIKRYRAIVRGALRGCGRVTARLSGDDSETEFRCVAVHESSKCGHVTLVDLWPRTGRTHQLRRHMMMLGHPILGDVKYWRRAPEAGAQRPSGVQVLEEAELAAAPENERAVLGREWGGKAADGAGVERDGGEVPADEARSEGGQEGVTVNGGKVGEKRARDDGGGEEEEAVNVQLVENGEGGYEGKWGRCDQAVALAERMCLWKVECRLLHPVTGQVVVIQTDMPELFQAVLVAHRPTEGSKDINKAI